MNRFYLIVFYALLSLSVEAAPWVDTDDRYLRADIQQLADHNIIKAPINHWPLSWSDIAADFREVKRSELSPAVAGSYQRVLFHYKNAQAPVSYTAIHLETTTDVARFSHYGDPSAERGRLSLKKGFVSDRFAGQLAIQAVQEPSDDKRYRIDGSYLAYSLGNWNLTLGSVPMWWGPGWDAALLVSTNARPVSGISLNRQRSTPFESPLLSWLGHWSFTTFMGQLEEERAISDALLWSTRASIRPLPALEIGLARSTMWAGDGRASDLSAFWDIITPSDSGNKVNNDRDVNDLGAVDIRWNDQLFGQPFGVYYEMGFEDYGISEVIPSKRSHLAGVDSDFHIGETLVSVFLEATDTYHETCQCIYTHDIYRTGYRYQGKIIGSTYGSNASSVTLGVIGQYYGGASWQANLRKVELNKQNEGKQVSSALYEDIWELDAEYRFIYWNSQWTLGTTLRRTEVLDESDNDLELSLGWKYLM